MRNAVFYDNFENWKIIKENFYVYLNDIKVWKKNNNYRNNKKKKKIAWVTLFFLILLLFVCKTEIKINSFYLILFHVLGNF